MDPCRAHEIFRRIKFSSVKKLMLEITPYTNITSCSVPGHCSSILSLSVLNTSLMTGGILGIEVSMASLIVVRYRSSITVLSCITVLSLL